MFVIIFGLFPFLMIIYSLSFYYYLEDTNNNKIVKLPYFIHSFIFDIILVFIKITNTSTIIMNIEAKKRYKKMLKLEISEKNKKKILFYGDSTFNYWNTLEQDFECENIINCSFHRSRSIDLLNNIYSLVLKWKPWNLFIHIGGNDYDTTIRKDKLVEYVSENIKKMVYLNIKNTYLEKMYIIFTPRYPNCSIDKWNYLLKLRSKSEYKINELYGSYKIKIIDLQKTVLDPTYYLFDKKHFSKKGFEFMKNNIKYYIPLTTNEK